ncbi:hypothetical protein HBH56_241260 [Parastagonospora nodorum]|uniref:Uncharacterized protein n=1 Tax=Phaeosphaeria nodorum (strain SN15 / ATCC MYA-4574 / FGSC 10173) TaxID=321614 RepID=A0A7U2FEG5_PHANO|nr:hypothetical protein HBH56_241260 [Parastagonospora nodorum]QRD03788.1 hypothetical protein JI435_163920 [Parastagonospora nodorum SN15]KAH3921219.1 hypothetical protein HBH54_243140 [Parastagonospora nodorum]KAH3939067.1 hypothetical protein HBH53_241070 [Parastagonospora nodorum]KAH4042731.1 hypothetical protein HBH49_244460 [Parastagonospora nodorum]
MPATAVPPNGDHELISGAKLDTLPRFHADHAGIPCSPLEKQCKLREWFVDPDLLEIPFHTHCLRIHANVVG